MRFLVAATIGGILALPGALAGQAEPSWFGIWQLNLARSTYDPGPPPFRRATHRIERSGDRIKITDDQVRLRANFERLPPTSDAYKRYLKKFDTQETEIESLQGQIKQKQEIEKQQQAGYEDYLAGLTVE